MLDSDASDEELDLVLQQEQGYRLRESRSATLREELLYDSKRVIGHRLWIETFSIVLIEKTFRLPY